MAAWVEYTTRNQVYAAYFNGTSWGAAACIDTDTTTHAESQQVAIDGSGNAIVVWAQNSRIYANRFTESSATWGGDATIDTGTTSSAPQIAMNESGLAMAVWNTQGASHDAFARPCSSTGTWGTTKDFDSAGALSSLPVVAIDPAGNAVIAWKQVVDIGTNVSVYASLYDNASGTWSDAASIDENGAVANDSSQPRVAMDASGNAMVVWSDDDGGAYQNLWYNFYKR